MSKLPKLFHVCFDLVEGSVRKLTARVQEGLGVDADLLTSANTHLDIAPHHWTGVAGFGWHFLTHTTQTQVLWQWVYRATSFTCMIQQCGAISLELSVNGFGLVARHLVGLSGQAQS